MQAPSKDDVYLDEPWLHVYWDNAHRCVQSEWKGFANSSEFRAGLTKALQAIRERHATGYVSDTRKIKVIIHEDQQWANKTLVPLMAAAGLKRMALVTAPGGLGRITVEEVVRMVNNRGLLMRTFDSKATAMNWIREV